MCHVGSLLCSCQTCWCFYVNLTDLFPFEQRKDSKYLQASSLFISLGRVNLEVFVLKLK